MKPATTINELANNLIPTQSLKREDIGLYVPIFEEKLRRLRDQIIYDEFESQTFYIAGQSGTGKSTALTFLPNDEVKKAFHVLYINGRELFDLNDLDIIDVLLMVGTLLIEGNKDLLKKYEEELIRIVENIRGTLDEVKEVSKSRAGEVETGAEVGVGTKFLSFFKAGANFAARFKMDRQVRETTRRVFRANMLELYNLTNEIVQRFTATLENKKLLIIFNDLDHLKDIQQIQRLFIDNQSHLKGLQCKKIISIPVHLTVKAGFNEETEFFGLKLKTNPLNDFVPPLKEKRVENSKKLLKEVIQRRVAEGVDLIDEDAIDAAINSSGGVVRQFMLILHQAAVNARSLKMPKITLEDIRHGKELASQRLQQKVISRQHIELLDEVRRKFVPLNQDSELFIQALLGNQILMYNNQPIWYEVNPLIQNMVEVYARNLAEEKKEEKDDAPA
jgi:Cdc6-like AAA superfamily ATPase